MMFLGIPVVTDVPVMQVTSEAFENGGYIPQKYSCDGENISPPLTIGNIPEDAESLVLIMDDPDAPVRTWTHWLVWNIKPVKKIKEASVPGIQGLTDFGTNSYGGPCPPSGIHHYHFKFYALNCMLDLETRSRKQDLEKAIKPHILAFGELVGLYRRAT